MYAHPNFHLFSFIWAGCVHLLSPVQILCVPFYYFVRDFLFRFIVLFFSFGFDRLDRNRDPYRRDTQLIVWSEGRDIPLTAAKAVDYLCITNETSHVVRQDSGEICHPRKWQAKIHLNQFLIFKSFLEGNSKIEENQFFSHFESEWVFKQVDWQLCIRLV
jgi:hypothetical protein